MVGEKERYWADRFSLGTSAVQAMLPVNAELLNVRYWHLADNSAAPARVGRFFRNPLPLPGGYRGMK